MHRRIKIVALLPPLIWALGAVAANHVRIFDVEISGGALIIPGSVTVTYGSGVRRLGWALIAFGTMVSTGSLKSKDVETLPGREVWQSLVRESRVYARHPELAATDTEVAVAARVMHLGPGDLARVVLALDDGDAAAVRARFFARGFADAEHARGFETMVRLARAP